MVKDVKELKEVRHALGDLCKEVGILARIEDKEVCFSILTACSRYLII